MAKGNTTDTSGTQNQTQTGTTSGSTSSSTGPWGAAQPFLQSILSQLGAQSTSPSVGQQGAAAGLVNSAGGIQNFGGQATGLANDLLSGGNVDPSLSGQISGNLTDLQRRLSPTADNQNFDPMQNPAMRGWLDTISNDASNATNGAFAAAGRDFSPANSQATARGISQGEAPVLAAQFNANRDAQTGAANTLYGAGNTTSGGLLNLQQIINGNRMSGLNVAGSVAGLTQAPGQAQLSAQNGLAGLPLSTLQQLEQLGIPVAGLGSQSSGSSSGSSNSTMTGSSNQSTTQRTDPTQQIIGGLLGAAGLFTGNPMAAMGGLSGLLGGGGSGGGGGPITYGGSNGPTPFYNPGGSSGGGGMGGWLSSMFGGH